MIKVASAFISRGGCCLMENLTLLQKVAICTLVGIPALVLLCVCVRTFIEGIRDRDWLLVGLALSGICFVIIVALGCVSIAVGVD